jgi:[ribosomal protein S5]-alanine N-acetyltransferase
MPDPALFRHLPTLETPRLTLRRLKAADAEAVYAYASDPEVAQYMQWERHRTVADSHSFIRWSLERYAEGRSGDWGVTVKGEDQLVGTCGFFDWDLRHARAEVGYVIARTHWNQGYMTEALRAMLAFGFGPMALTRIQGLCVSENAASARVMEKAGMRREGTLRKYLFLKGAHRDMLVHAAVKGDRPLPHP